MFGIKRRLILENKKILAQNYFAARAIHQELIQMGFDRDRNMSEGIFQYILAIKDRAEKTSAEWCGNVPLDTENVKVLMAQNKDLRRMYHQLVFIPHSQGPFYIKGLIPSFDDYVGMEVGYTIEHWQHEKSALSDINFSAK